jgi:hypothetical protein
LLAWLILVAPALGPSLQLGDRDTARLYFPVKRFIADALLRGQLPFWDPWTEGGVSLLGQMTPGVLHPFTLLYGALPFHLAFKLNHLLALLVGGAGAAALAARLGGSWAVAGIAFGGCGALLSAASSNLPFALGHATVPCALAALLAHLRAPSPLKLLGASALLASCAFAGDPQSMLVAALFGVALAAHEEKPYLQVSAWAALGLVLSLPVALPAAAQLEHSARSALSGSERGALSVLLPRLLGLLVPRIFDGTEAATASAAVGQGPVPFFDVITFGAPGLLLAAGAARARRGPLLLAAAIFFAIQAANDTVLAAVVPLWRYFRYPEKLVLPASLALALAASLGAEARPRWLWRAAIALAAAAAALSLWRAELLEVAGLAALTAGALFLSRSEKKNNYFFFAAPAAVCFIAALLAVPRAVQTVPASAFERKSLTGEELLRRAGPSEGRWRVLVEPGERLRVPGSMEPHEGRLLAAREAMWPQLPQLDGIEGLAPYFSAPDRDFAAAFHGAHRNLAALFGARFQVVDGEAPARSPSGYGIRELSPPGPRASLVPRARAVANAGEAVAALVGSDPREEAVFVGTAPQAGGSGAVSYSRRAPDRIELEIEANAPALVVVAERFDPGWSLRIDGAPAELRKANLSALSFAAPAGRHHAVLRFLPWGLLPGLALAAAACLALVGLQLKKNNYFFSRGPAA